MDSSVFGAPLMECKLQTTNVWSWYASQLYLFLLTFVALQVCSLCYHAASGNIIVGLYNGQVELWQTDPYIALSSAPQVTLPAHECVRERLAEAQALANDIQASLDKADSGLRQQMSREQELKRSIADLEVKCAPLLSRGRCPKA